MSSDNRLHSFTISPLASSIIHEVRNKKKSKFVSDAIVHYREWQHTDHSELKISDYPGVKDVKDINLALQEKERLLKTWVKRANDFQEALISLENSLDASPGKKWWQFWK
jgi:hypothetical protein